MYRLSFFVIPSKLIPEIVRYNLLPLTEIPKSVQQDYCHRLMMHKKTASHETVKHFELQSYLFLPQHLKIKKNAFEHKIRINNERDTN